MSRKSIRRLGVVGALVVLSFVSMFGAAKAIESTWSCGQVALGGPGSCPDCKLCVRLESDTVLELAVEVVEPASRLFLCGFSSAVIEQDEVIFSDSIAIEPISLEEHGFFSLENVGVHGEVDEDVFVTEAEAIFASDPSDCDD